MSKGHGIIINLSSYLPFIFTFNPTEVNTNKKINYFEAPNIGGSHHENFFTGFGNREISFTLICIDKEDPIGVTAEIAYFEALREPAPPLLGLFGATIGNENYPPPKVLFNFGTGDIIPLVWTVKDVSIKNSMLMSGSVRGIIGIPRRIDVNISLSLVEDDILNKANIIAKKAGQIAASAESLIKETVSRIGNKRREKPGIWPLIREDF